VSPLGCAMFSLQLHIPLQSMLAKRVSMIQVNIFPSFSVFTTKKFWFLMRYEFVLTFSTNSPITYLKTLLYLSLYDLVAFTFTKLVLLFVLRY